MRENGLRRSLSVLPMGTVIKLTGLSARQIRYYEEKGLVSPQRSRGNRRLYSLNDVDRVLDIKDKLDAGFNIADIKVQYRHLHQKDAKRSQQSLHQTVSDNEARHLLKNELLNMGGLGSDSPFHHNYPV